MVHTSQKAEQLILGKMPVCDTLTHMACTPVSNLVECKFTYSISLGCERKLGHLMMPVWTQGGHAKSKKKAPLLAAK